MIQFLILLLKSPKVWVTAAAYLALASLIFSIDFWAGLALYLIGILALVIYAVYAWVS